MERIVIHGDEKEIIGELSNYINPDDVRIVVRSLPVFRELIEDDETLEIRKGSQEQGSGMAFVIPKTNYYINLKVTTIAFIGLILDIAFAEGFAAFILGLFGVTADVIRKLSDTEKCVLLFVKEDAVLPNEGKYTLRDSLPCINYARECGCRQYDKCGLSEETLTATVQKLLEKSIIKQTGNSLEYRF